MTDEEWIKTIPSLTNKELLDKLDYCGYDNYYSKIREPIIAEIARKLEENERLKKDSEENQDLATIAYIQGASKNKAELNEAKAIIEKLSKSLFLAKGLIRDLIDDTVDFKESKERAIYCYEQEKFDAYKEAERFLKEK